ncbi:MAG: glycerol-3-phosphate dehydrogenase/oxidase [Burkholderiales bacterium]|nr:glycerol-3-phosphate dehydrogenase/oxidase [Burkholderiales bacterium]
MTYDFDIIIIGGGATGLGTALEAITRGYKVLLLEGHDFGKGTSSKSTKLVHGGLRYLANLDIALVKEGLEERYYFLNNAPHLAKKQTYLIPLRNWYEKSKYFLGTKLYDTLSGKLKIGRSKMLNKSSTLLEAPNLNHELINGSAIYYDGQFDDTRLLITLLRTFEERGGLAFNYHLVSSFQEQNGHIYGVSGKNTLTNEDFTYTAKVVINATGTFCDSTNQLADNSHKYENVAVAQGTHLVFDKDVFDSKHAILVPETIDGRVLFILPWHDKIVVGTTDVKVEKPTLEPTAKADEIQFILNTLNQYGTNKVSNKDIRSVFCGQRPLVKPKGSTSTAKISRKHEIFTTDNKMVTIVGGKWTIYRRMGQDTIDYIEKEFGFKKTNSITRELKLFAYSTDIIKYPLSSYGSDINSIDLIQKELHNYGKLHDRLPYLQAEVIYHVRYEKARTVEDILLRRTRAMFLDAKAALESAQVVADLMAAELKHDGEWKIKQLHNIALIAEKFTVGKL